MSLLLHCLLAAKKKKPLLLQHLLWSSCLFLLKRQLLRLPLKPLLLPQLTLQPLLLALHRLLSTPLKTPHLLAPPQVLLLVPLPVQQLALLQTQPRSKFFLQ